MNISEKKKIHTSLSVRSACFLMAAVAMSRGSSFLMSKQLLGDMEPLNLLGLRFLIAFLILFIIFFKKNCITIRKNPRILAAALLLGGTYFLCMAAELIGLQYTTASTCSFLENSAIVIVPLFEAILLRRLPSGKIMTSTVITLTGIGLIVLCGNGHIGIGFGEVLCMIAALMYTFAIIITDRLSKKYEPMTLGILYVGVIGLMGMVSSVFTETPHLPSNGSGWLLLLGLALLCSCFGFTMQPVAQKPLTSEKAGIICALNPLTTALLGFVILGEQFGPLRILGAALIIGGILLPNIKGRRPQHATPLSNVPNSMRHSPDW